MNNKRIIPRLDIKGPNLVKGIHLEGLRVLGKPEDFAKLYYEQGADELIYQDTVASLYQRNSLSEIISKTIKDVFIPITVAGGIRSLNDIKQVLRAGADKVCINTSAIENPAFIREASQEFGSSTIVVAIEVCLQKNGKYLAFTDNGREYTGVDALEWAKQVEHLGAGEILLTSIDREGTGEGYDIKLYSDLTKELTIPLIAHGGASKLKHISELIQKSNVDGVSMASILHYSAIKELNQRSENQFAVEGNIDFFKKKNSFKDFGSENIPNIKKFLKKNNINVRS